MAHRYAGGISVATILVVAALVMAILALAGVYNPALMLTLAVIALCIAFLV